MQVKGSLKEDLRQKIYMISFNLSGKKDNYDALTAEIKKFTGWCKVWDTQWLVYTRSNSTEICHQLQPVLSSSDWLFVCNVTADRMGLISANAVEWLDKVSKAQK